MAALEQANDIARLAQAAELLGVARQAYDMTLEYLKTRVQFGKPIGANQALQHRMVDAYIAVELAAACLRDVLEQHERGDQPLAALASRPAPRLNVKSTMAASLRSVSVASTGQYRSVAASAVIRSVAR